MRVFVVGEWSNLAVALTDHLREQNPDWVWLNAYDVNLVNPKTMLDGAHYEFDVSRPESSMEIANLKPDLLINAAGLVNSYKCYDEELMALQSNYITALYITHAMRMLPDAKLVHFGTTASTTDQDASIDESTPPQLMQTAYSLTKWLGELEIRKLDVGQYLNIRPVFVYGGKMDTSSVISKLIWRGLYEDYSNQLVNLNLSALKAPLYIKDFVKAVGELIRMEECGTFVVGNDKEFMPYMMVLDMLYEKGIDGARGIHWDQAHDSLGNHVASIEKLRGAVFLGDWPKYSLHAGLDEFIMQMRSEYNRAQA